jgi:hypothetical protein
MLKNVKFLIVLMVVLGINSARGQAIVDKLVSKPWEGSGVLMGSPADFKMNWEWTLNKQFLRLTFQNKRKAENGNEQIFMAEAFYKPVNDSLVKGSWFDSRGLSFPLSGTIEDRKLTVLWGSPKPKKAKQFIRWTAQKISRSPIIS